MKNQISFKWPPIYTGWNAWHTKRKDNSLTIIDRLLTEVYTFLNNYPSVIVNDVFHRRQNTYLWNFHAFANDVSRNNYLLNSVVYKASQLWRPLSFYLLVLAKIIQEWIKKLVLHWIPMSNLLKRLCWRWIHLIVHTS